MTRNENCACLPSLGLGPNCFWMQMRRCQWAFEGQLYAAGRCPAGLARGHVLPLLAYPPSQAHPPSGKERSLLCWFYHPQTFHVRPIVHIDFDRLYYRQACSWQMLSTLQPTTMEALEICQPTSQVSTSIKLFCLFFHRQFSAQCYNSCFGMLLQYTCNWKHLPWLLQARYKHKLYHKQIVKQSFQPFINFVHILWTKIPVQSCPPWYLIWIVSDDTGAW